VMSWLIASVALQAFALVDVFNTLKHTETVSQCCRCFLTGILVCFGKLMHIESFKKLGLVVLGKEV
jgi:hypothetical protein